MSDSRPSFHYILTFSRDDKSCWLAHLDQMRVFERSLRRANVPVSWSQGFNPRPELVFALPASCGLELMADPVDLALVEEMDEDRIMDSLNRNLPRGMSVVSVKRWYPGKVSLMSLVERASYRLEGPAIGTVTKALMDSNETMNVNREHKGQIRRYDLREYILNWHSENEDSFSFECLAGSSRNMRVDLLTTVLTERSLMSLDQVDDLRYIREQIGFAAEFEANFKE